MKICRLSGQKSRRAFSTLVVIVSMVFLSAAIMSMSGVFAHEVARTRGVRAQIQLRQLLLAAVPAARQDLAANGPAPRDVQIAVPLEGAILSLHVSAASAGGSEVTATATLSGYTAVETLSFSSDYELKSIKLIKTQGE